MMPLFEYKFYRKLQEGGTRKTKCVRNKTQTLRSWSQSGCRCLNTNVCPPPPEKENENHAQQDSNKDTAANSSGDLPFDHKVIVFMCRVSLSPSVIISAVQFCMLLDACVVKMN
jgi:hypothetical protein